MNIAPNYNHAVNEERTVYLSPSEIDQLTDSKMANDLIKKFGRQRVLERCHIIVRHMGEVAQVGGVDEHPNLYGGNGLVVRLVNKVTPIEFSKRIQALFNEAERSTCDESHPRIIVQDVMQNRYINGNAQNSGKYAFVSAGVKHQQPNLEAVK